MNVSGNDSRAANSTLMCVCVCMFICFDVVFVSGAIALAEVLAESRYLIQVDLRENEIRIAGLMALNLALRMNHKLLHLETPKTFKVEQVSGERMKLEI